MRLILLAFAIVSFLYVIPSNARELKILNLNMWAVELGWPEYFVSSPSLELNERIHRLPGEIAKLQPDLIVFEEVWSDNRAEEIKALLKPLGYAYNASKSSDRGWFLDGGNGLLIVSKFKLDPEVQAFSYSTSTRWDESKFICRKGGMKTRVELEPNKWVDLYATHLGATGVVTKNGMATEFTPNELKIQGEQIKEFIAFVNQTHTMQSMIVAADLNSHPFAFESGKYSETKHSDVYRLLTCADGVTDCLHLKDNSASAKFFTYDTSQNHYAKSADFATEPEGRIDYVFSQGEELAATASSLAFKDNPLSDHYGLTTSFEFKPTVEVRQALRLPSAAAPSTVGP